MVYKITHVSTFTGYIAVAVAGVVIGVLASYIYLFVSQQSLQAALESNIASQVVAVSSLAEITDRNEADAVVTSIIRDCNSEDRKRFDELMEKLTESILRTELQTLDQLHGACGNFHAVQKASMVARLAAEVDDLKTLVSLVSINKSNAQQVHRLNDWEHLVELEELQAEAFFRLAAIERSLIQGLIAGSTLSSTNMQTLLQQARDVRALQEVYNVEIDTLRASLSVS